jgi:hypothetical protein
MSDTKMAASLRVSLTGANAEVGSPVTRGLGMAALPHCTKDDVEAGSADPAYRLAKPIHDMLTITHLPKEE